MAGTSPRQRLEVAEREDARDVSAAATFAALWLGSSVRVNENSPIAGAILAIAYQCE